MSPTQASSIGPSIRSGPTTSIAGEKGRATRSGKVKLPAVSSNFTAVPHRRSARTTLPATDLGLAVGLGVSDITVPSDPLPKRKKRIRSPLDARTAAKNRRKEKKQKGENPVSVAPVGEENPMEKAPAVTLTPEDEGLGVPQELPADAGDVAYLTVLNGDEHVTVLRHLIRMNNELRPSNPIRGRIVAFAGGARKGEATPRLVVLDDEDARFQPRAFPAVNANLVAQYHRSGRHLEYGPPQISEMTGGDGAKRTFRQLVPIPTEWADQFMDSPKFEEVCGRLETLTSQSTKENKKRHYQFRAMASTAMCIEQEGGESVMAIKATPLILTPLVREMSERLWKRYHSQEAQHDSTGEKSLQPDAVSPQRKREEKSQQPDAVSPSRTAKEAAAVSPERAKKDAVPPAKAVHTWSESDESVPSDADPEHSRRDRSNSSSSGGSSSNSSSSSEEEALPSSGEEESLQAAPVPLPKAQPVTPPQRKPKPSHKRKRQEDAQQQFLDAFVALSAKNLKIALKATKKAARSTGSPASRMSAIRLEWLEACAGHDDDQEDFQRPPVYDEFESAGGTRDAALAVLRRRCVEVKGSRNKCRVHVTSKMALTFKSGNFSAGNDRTYEGCTAGVTPFAVPKLSQKQAHDDTLDQQAFEDATLKTQADNKKFLAGQKFIPPKNLAEVIRNLNNYICWAGVMVGSDCPHLLMVVKLRDALDDNEDALDLAMCRYLRMSILWKVHEDARQFFDSCEKWNRGEPTPKSKLKGTVRLLEDDQMVNKSITCPFDDFFADEKRDKTGKQKGGGGGGAGGSGEEKKKKGKDKAKREPQPTSNPSIPPLCAAAVKKYHAAHPDMSITQFAGESGMPVTKFVLGNRGGCTNFQLLGRCVASCDYNHVAFSGTDEKQKAVASALLEGLKLIADKKKEAAA